MLVSESLRPSRLVSVLSAPALQPLEGSIPPLGLLPSLFSETSDHPLQATGFPGGSLVKNPPAKVRYARDVGSIPGSGRSPGGGHGNPLQYSCLENPMGRGTWWATVHGVTKSWTQLSMPALHYLGYSSLRRTAKHFRCRHSRLRSLPSLSVETHTVSQTEISRPDPPWLWLSGASATMLVP